MPAPARTSRDSIVAAARTLLETNGLEGLTMRRVAMAVAVRPPSLYKHVRNRGDLVRLVMDDVARELSTTIGGVVGSGDARRDLVAVARAFRAFAHAHPRAYELVFASLPEAWRMEPAALAEATEVLMRMAAELVGEDRALQAARTVTAWAHGFVSMELAGAFRLGGSVEDAFEFGIERLAAALSP